MTYIEWVLSTLLVVFLFVENLIFIRFCLSNKVFLVALLKFLTFIIVIVSLGYPWFLVSFVFLNLSISFFTAFVYQLEYRFFFIKYKSIEFNDSNLIKKLFGVNDNLLVSTKFLDELIDSVYNLSEKKIGALIVIERKISLDYYINNGYAINSDVNAAILESIFNKYSPLHDGAVIIRDGRIVAAKCFLPLNTSDVLDVEGKVFHSLGARHRAAIGITQTTDAISIVVSETNSSVSFCVDGKIKYNLNSEELYDSLKKEIIFNTIPFEKIEKLS
ncbi:MAG: DNA integrity scanning protein DisA nucleotide-binding domain protein [bacterium]|nr:DNA integrity scanning protein DisA nucleotide-binding domain protein [bacterium]